MYKESAGKICSVFGGEGKRKAERREREKHYRRQRCICERERAIQGQTALRGGEETVTQTLSHLPHSLAASVRDSADLDAVRKDAHERSRTIAPGRNTCSGLYSSISERATEATFRGLFCC